MIINNSGVAIRISINNIRIAGRNTQGVTLIKVPKDEVIKSIAKISNVDEENNENINEDVNN